MNAISVAALAPAILRHHAERARALVCAGMPCMLTAEYLVSLAVVADQRLDATRDSLARRAEGLSDPRFEALRALLIEAWKELGG